MASKPKATPAAILRGALQTLPDQFVVCRDVRHAWATLNEFHVTPSQSEGGKRTSIARDLVCMRCDTIRHEVYQETRLGLEKLSQSYEYPGGYQIAGVPRGVKPSLIIQQEQYRRAMQRVANAAPNETETAER